jgi:hypothetical protein
MEAAELVATGHDPVLVEYAARSAGMVVPPLKVFDEVTLTLAAHAVGAREAHTGEKMDSAGLRLVRRLVELGRGGKAAGQGFYDYTAKPRRLWSGLREMAESAPAPEETGLERIRERLMLAQVLEAARCLEEGVLRSTRDAEIGAIFGVGFAPGSGGPLAWLDRFGQRRAVTALDALAAQHGARYAPNAALRAMAEDGPIAAAFGINQKGLSLVLAGICAALAAVAGICLAMTFTLTPSQIFAWVGVVFAVVMLGGLGSALGPLVGGIIIGVSEAITMAVASPSWAPIVSFSLLIFLLLLRPGKI